MTAPNLPLSQCCRQSWLSSSGGAAVALGALLAFTGPLPGRVAFAWFGHPAVTTVKGVLVPG